MKKSLTLVKCAECGARLSVQAEACSECGYPHIRTAASLPRAAEDLDSAQAIHGEYRLLQAGGLIVLVAGILAALADSRFAAGVTLTVGGTIYLAGVLGAWWNRRD